MGELIVDGFNVVELTSLGIKLESIEDKIIVMMDSYRSGYECKTCNGKGTVTTKSIVPGGKDKEETCGDCKGSGHVLFIPEISKSIPTSGIVVSMGENTRWIKHLKRKNNRELCASELKIDYLTEELIDKALELEEKEIKIRIGARVIFSPHVGTLIPFKGNIRLKIMREHEPLAVMYGADAASRDFMEFDQDFRET